LLAVACSSSPSQPQPTVRPPSPIAEIISALESGASKLRDKTVAVAEFSELHGGIYVPSAQGRLLAERITTELVNTSTIDVVERAQLDKVLSELRLNLSGLVDEHSTTSVGKLLGVEAIVIGTLTPVGKETEIHCRMVQVENGRILAAVTTREILPLAPQADDRAKNAPRSSSPEPSLESALGDHDRVAVLYEALFLEGRFEDLQRATSSALLTPPGNALALLYQALLLREANQPAQAQEYLRNALDYALREPRHAQAIRLLCGTLFRVNRPFLARRMLLWAITKQPQLRSDPAMQDLLRRFEIR
jgi:tetratricopeptide (TPR) repeat protein